MRLRTWITVAAAWLAAGSATAEQSFVDWSVGVLDDRSGAYAATASDTGAVLGEFCTFSGVCKVRLLIPVNCEAGAVYPALVNSDMGGVHITLICEGKVNDIAHFSMREPDIVRGLFRQATRIGFAVTMKHDEFRVFRFSLNGAIAATTFMRDAVARGSKSGSGNLRDARL